MLLELFSEMISLFLLLLLDVFSGCMKSVPSRSHWCPPNRGTAGVLTLHFTTIKVSSINAMKPHKTCTQTHTNIHKHMLMQQTQAHKTTSHFSVSPQPHKRCKIWTSSDVAIISYSCSHKKHRVKMLNYMWAVTPRISSLPVYFKPASICYRERLLVIYFKTVAHTCWDFRFCTFCTIDMKNTSSPAACCEEMCCYF